MEAGFVALGLVQGALAGLNALGLVLLWRTTRVVNLAQPAMGLVGGVLAGMLVAGPGWGFWWAAPLGIATGAALGLAAERLVMARLAAAPRTVSMVATIGLAALFQALQSGIPFVLGGRLPSYDVDIGFEVFVFPVLLKGPHLLALATLPAAVALLWWFVHRSRVGTAAVAAGQDLERAQTLGVHAGFVRAVAWSAAGALSGVAGVLSIPVLGFSLGDGVAPTVLLLALAPAVLAGLRSLPATAVASLAVGVAYQFVLVEAPTAGLADVFLAATIVAALGLRRRRSDRAAVAARTSSWAAATAPLPVPRAVRRDRRWRRVATTGAVGLVAVGALPPLWLPPSGDVRYGTSAALVLGAVAVAAAWIFSGEIALGHWGVAALGATAAHATPGPLAVRVLAGVGAGVAVGLALALVGRRRGALTSTVAGLAVAVAAPYWLVRAGTPALSLDGEVAAAVAGSTAAAAALAVTWLRGQAVGVRMVAARDDPRRARSLGVSPARASAVGMALSGGLAALAGVVYLASVPAGVAPGAFGAERSLDIVAFAVIGGLGSAVGAALGAAALLVAGVLLPAPWDAVATGAGMLWALVFAPAGVASQLTRLRDRAARIVRPDAFAVRPAAPPGTARDDAVERGDERRAVVAGSDTRDALRTPTVRAAMVAAFCIGGVSLAALFASPMAMDDHLGVGLGDAAPWYVLAVAGIGALAAAASWRGDGRRLDVRWSADVVVPGGVGAALAAFVVTGDELMVTATMLVGPIIGAWSLARLARSASGVVVPRSRAAATGLVVASAVGGGTVAAHLAAVAAGNDVLDAARWAAVYLAAATVATGAAAARRPVDRARARQRAAAGAPRPAQRRRWAPLRVESLTVDLGAQRVLDGVDLEVPSGDVVALLGGNGAGKSTLLRTVAGLTEPAGGRIDVAGEEVTALRPDERSAIGVAFVNGARPVFPDLSVRENLRVGAYLTHRARRSFTAALDGVLEVVPLLADRLDTRAGVLSGGEQRHLAIAQTLFRRPAVLLADELTLGLDVSSQAAVFDLLRTLADDGMGVVVVDHDLDAVIAIADRVVVVHGGATTELTEPAAFRDASRDLLPARFLVGAPR